MKKPVLILVRGVALAAALQSIEVMAHEGRIIEDATGTGVTMSLTVGHRTEPAVEDQMNRFDAFMRFDKDGDGKYTDPVDVRNGDTVNITVRVLLLGDDEYDAKVLDSAELVGRLRQDGDLDFRYNIDYMPTVDGPYGFEITGTVTSGASTIEIDEKYVCGGGSQNPGGGFSCISDAQAFPENGTKANNAHKDNDNYSVD